MPTDSSESASAPGPHKVTNSKENRKDVQLSLKGVRLFKSHSNTDEIGHRTQKTEHRTQNTINDRQHIFSHFLHTKLEQ